MLATVPYSIKQQVHILTDFQTIQTQILMSSKILLGKFPFQWICQNSKMTTSNSA